MKIQTSSGEEISTTEVAKLPANAKAEAEALNASESAEEFLAALPDLKTCSKCKKKTAEANDSGECRVCHPVPSIAEEARSAVAAAKAAEPRPSLLVETEVNTNLLPRVQAHIGRMRAWDLRKLGVESRAAFAGALDAVDSSFSRLEGSLRALAREGFVAKTTPVTRIAAKLSVGAHIELRSDQKATFASVYSEEQLNSLSVAKTTDTHVQLVASDGTNVGLVKIIHVSLKE